MKMATRCAALLPLFFLVASPAFSAGKAMTGEELMALLKDGKKLALGGKGEGYSGELMLNKDGTGKGVAKTDDGKKTFNLVGTWKIKGNRFCPTWTEFNKGKETCEIWIKDGENRVVVMQGKKKVGVNSW